MKRILVPLALVMAVFLSSCALGDRMLSEFEQAWRGKSATMTTYDQNGDLIDKVVGESFRVSLDKRFDRTEVNSEGTSTTVAGDVMMISLGESHINHVGSTMILAERGLTAVAGGETKVDIVSTKPGVPWLNDLLEYNRNLWKGKGKTVMIRSQDGKPIAVFAGDAVELVGTDIPKTTWFQVDGLYLFVYRADYTIYDNDLLGG